MIFSKANAPRFTSFDSLNDRDVACRETVPSVRSGRVEVTVLENKGAPTWLTFRSFVIISSCLKSRWVVGRELNGGQVKFLERNLDVYACLLGSKDPLAARRVSEFFTT